MVPTWNYIAVEARGPLSVAEDEAALRAMLAGLTDRHEAGRAAPWSVDDAPAEYMAAMLRGIVGVRVAVTSLRGAWKLDQKKSEVDRAGAVAGLAAEGRTLAEPMAAWRKAE